MGEVSTARGAKTADDGMTPSRLGRAGAGQRGGGGNEMLHMVSLPLIISINRFAESSLGQ